MFRFSNTKACGREAFCGEFVVTLSLNASKYLIGYPLELAKIVYYV